MTLVKENMIHLNVLLPSLHVAHNFWCDGGIGKGEAGNMGLTKIFAVQADRTRCSLIWSVHQPIARTFDPGEGFWRQTNCRQYLSTWKLNNSSWSGIYIEGILYITSPFLVVNPALRLWLAESA